MVDKSELIGVPLWLKVSISDLEGLDFEHPIRCSVSADCSEISQLFHATTQTLGDSAELPQASHIRVFNFLAALTGMYLKPNDRHEPFGPMFSSSDKRSAIPSDFYAHLDLIASMARLSVNVVLRSRLSDVAWLLDRKRGDLAINALVSYASLLQKVQSGKLNFRVATKGSVLERVACDYLRRALHIGRSVGWEKVEVDALRRLTVNIWSQALREEHPHPIVWFCGLDLDHRISDPLLIAHNVEGFLSKPLARFDYNTTAELWELASRAYHVGKDEISRDKCKASAAECYAVAADAFPIGHGSAMMASHILSTAITKLHGLPGQKDRRTELRHKLVDRRARISEEMSSFSHEIDLRELLEAIKEDFSKANLFDKLFLFANLSRSPDPDELRAEAEESIRKFPLSSLFGVAHLDREGKTIFRSEGGLDGASEISSSIANQIARSESIRRQMVVQGGIETARHAILNEHYISEDVLVVILRDSPFISDDLLDTYVKGFTKFFHGDQISAIYILTPLLENSLRYVLKSSGHDVTIFDDATQTQEDRTISTIYEHMRQPLESILGSNVVEDLENVFLKKPGPHLRHTLAHGLFHDATPYTSDAIYGCWLLFSIALLPLFQYREALRINFPFS